jgi:hypothetical protein
MANGLFAGGDGSELNPFLIEDAHDLNAVRNNLTANYKLIKDIDLNVSPYNEGEGWDPIGWKIGENGAPTGSYFEGIFNGDGHTIKNLYINKPLSRGGLFFSIDHGEGRGLCKNLKVVNAFVSIGIGSGILSGVRTRAECVYVSGYIEGQGDIGGICGGSNGGVFLKNCVSEARVKFVDRKQSSWSKKHYGGLGGNVVNYVEILNCYSVSKVEGTGTNQGGLVGNTNRKQNIINSFWDKEVSGQSTSAGGTGKITSQMQTAQTFIDAGWDKEELEDGTKIWILKDGEYPKLWFEEDVESIKCLVKSENNYYTYQNNEFIEVEPTEENFINGNINLSILTTPNSEGVKPIMTIDNPEIVALVDNNIDLDMHIKGFKDIFKNMDLSNSGLLINSTIEPKINITSIPKPQMIFPTGDIIIPSGANLLNVAVEGKSSDDLVKMIFSIDSGNTWLALDESNNIIQIDHNNLDDVKNKGMTLSMINNVGSIWSNLVSDKIRFAYYLEIESLDDEEYLDNLDITLYVPGKWKVIDEYRYRYGNEKIYIRLYKDGSYKINYME